MSKKSSTFIEKLILFAVFMIFAGVVVGFAFSWNYVSDDEGRSDSKLSGSFQYITVSKPETSDIAGDQQLVQSEQSSGKININTATAEELDTLPGIGQTRAEAILQYRMNESTFLKIEDIKNVSGIGDKLFEQIKDYITVD